MPDTPLNPDALDKAALAMCHYVVANREMGHGIRPVYHQYQSAKAVVSAYLAAAQPVVNGVVDVPATMTCIAWEKEPEHGLWKISENETFVGLIVKAGRSWSPADKYTLRIERPEVNDA